MKRAFIAIALASAVPTLSTACSSIIDVSTGGATGTGGAPGSSSAVTTASSSTATTATSSTTTATAAASSTATSTSSTSTSSSSGASCPSSCAADVDCETCPKTDFGQVFCCDPSTSACYGTSDASCPSPCFQGGACNGGTCDTSCVSCTCDGTGHYACTPPPSWPVCPAVHPTCGDTCDPSQEVACTCSIGPGQGTAGCSCDTTTSTWSCLVSPNGCPPAVPQASLCTDFAVGTTCALGCTCTASCGTQLWSCQEF